MTSSSNTFSLPCYRRLQKEMGELDAMVEMTELAARYFVAAAANKTSVKDFVAAASKSHGVCVNVSELASFQTHLYRHHIVVVYESADRFFTNLRREHLDLLSRENSGDAKGIDKLSLALKNMKQSTHEMQRFVGKDLISLFLYYRAVRNWVLHEDQCVVETVEAEFENLIPWSPENEKEYKKLTAPNSPEKLCFDDFVLFSRIAKTIGERFSQASIPQGDEWSSVLDGHSPIFKKLAGNTTRIRKKISVNLKTVFGLDTTTADQIAFEIEQKHDSLM